MKERKNWKDLFPTPIYTLASFDIKLPRVDLEKTYYVLKSKNWVNVVPITKTGEILLIKQYRHGIGEESLEIPGGIVDDDGPEAEFESVVRELREETGYATDPSKIRLLSKFSGNPAMFTNWSYSYVAYDVEPIHDVEFDEGEDIEIVLKTPNEVKQLLREGAIHHPHMAAALGFYFLFEKSGT
ncbi:NUDIX domain protein [Leptospira yanagawae serovar Saopaulo str. Sao Paulo = ATCC 700523]|uniref:GDP-mannose pyrophosphatase n=1 Tax=Leptospira yanagawae serovar Saopaulo str. Sao Paulo = ATCC 700523 TaxID=1249483 RepID=A0A5E8HAV4_9LEPT|nr:NUDIX hydrolase [Leptospira yanagawae]EOQ88395.1 NUDIX domain protein [Leptospira yanagawae serovar Saopaulo str. Sao Paulo = ATCC 700523]